jgi:hypothetical protein
MVDERLPGGNAGGATRVGDTVRRNAGPWTPAVHSLLRHLQSKGFDGAPLPLGIDDQGREILTFLEETPSAIRSHGRAGHMQRSRSTT